mgnify:CR=1 FL=1
MTNALLLFGRIKAFQSIFYDLNKCLDLTRLLKTAIKFFYEFRAIYVKYSVNQF